MIDPVICFVFLNTEERLWATEWLRLDVSFKRDSIDIPYTAYNMYMIKSIAKKLNGIIQFATYTGNSLTTGERIFWIAIYD